MRTCISATTTPRHFGGNLRKIGWGTPAPPRNPAACATGNSASSIPLDFTRRAQRSTRTLEGWTQCVTRPCRTNQRAGQNPDRDAVGLGAVHPIKLPNGGGLDREAALSV